MYAERAPQARCAMLAKVVREACVLSGSESLTVAEEFYCGMHDVHNTLTLVLRDDTVSQSYENACRDHSIRIALTEE